MCVHMTGRYTTNINSSKQLSCLREKGSHAFKEDRVSPFRTVKCFCQTDGENLNKEHPRFGLFLLLLFLAHHFLAILPPSFLHVSVAAGCFFILPLCSEELTGMLKCL